MIICVSSIDDDTATSNAGGTDRKAWRCPPHVDHGRRQSHLIESPRFIGQPLLAHNSGMLIVALQGFILAAHGGASGRSLAIAAGFTILCAEMTFSGLLPIRTLALRPSALVKNIMLFQNELASIAQHASNEVIYRRRVISLYWRR